MISYLILKETLILFLYILRQVGIEDKSRYLCIRHLCAIFYLDILTLDTLWRSCLDDRQHHLIQLTGTNTHLTIQIYLLCCLEHLEDTLLGKGRSKDDWEIYEWSHPVPDGSCERKR